MSAFRTWLVRCLILAPLVGMAACASPADPTAMVPEQVIAGAERSAFTDAIGSTKTVGGEETSPLWKSEISGNDFNQALTTALTRSGFLSSIGDLEVMATLISIDQPFVGISMQVDTLVRYEIRDASGIVVFDETIPASYTAEFSDAFLGVERLKLANEGAARANIQKFLEALARIRPEPEISDEPQA